MMQTENCIEQFSLALHRFPSDATMALLQSGHVPVSLNSDQTREGDALMNTVSPMVLPI